MRKAGSQPEQTSAGAASTAESAPLQLAAALLLIGLFFLPLSSGGYSGAGYQVAFVLLPIGAAIALLKARPLSLVASCILLAQALSLALLPFWIQPGQALWFYMLQIPCAWILTSVVLREVPARAKLILPVIAISGALTALYGGFLWLGAGRLDYLISSTFGLHNAYAGYLLLAWPAAAVAGLQCSKAWARFLYGAASALLAVTLVLTYSKASIVCLGLQLLALGGCLLWLRLRHAYGARGARGAAIGLGAAVALTLGLLALPTVRDAFSRITDFGSYSMQGRLRFWQAALQIFRDHWLTGVGPGNFAFVYPHYQLDWKFYSVDPHSWPLQLLSELGLAGALILLAVLAGLALWCWRLAASIPPPDAAPAPPGAQAAVAEINIAIMAFIAQRFDLVIGAGSAGAAWSALSRPDPQGRRVTTLVRGTDKRSGQPRTVNMHSGELAEALGPAFASLQYPSLLPQAKVATTVPIEAPAAADIPHSALCATLLISAVLGSLLHASFDFDYTFTATTSLLGVLLAFGTYLAGIERHVAVVPGWQPRPSRAARIAGSACAVLLLVAALAGECLTLERFALDNLFGRALSSDARIATLRSAIRFNPRNARTRYQLASLLIQPQPSEAASNLPQRRDEALKELAACLRLNPLDAQVWALRGLLSRDPAEGNKDLAKAIELDPYNYPEHYYYWAKLAPDDASRLERLQRGNLRIPANEPLPPDALRPEWYSLNAMWQQEWEEMAKLTQVPRDKELYQQRADAFKKYLQEQARDNPAEGAPGSR